MTRREQLIDWLSYCSGGWTPGGEHASFDMLATVGLFNRQHPESPITWDEVRAVAERRARMKDQRLAQEWIVRWLGRRG